MRCRVTKCIHNEDGYCYRESYVEIDENGECDEMCVPSEEHKEGTD